MSEEGSELLKILHQVDTKINDLSMKVERVSDNQVRDNKMLNDHDKLLVRGSDNSPSLSETIREMVRTQNRLIDEIAKERKDIKDRQDSEEKRKKEEWGKWKWALISLGLVTIPKFAWDFSTFWITVVGPALGRTP
jgi:hypothetical protein